MIKPYHRDPEESGDDLVLPRKNLVLPREDEDNKTHPRNKNQAE
jgi:hypothetical protein